MHDQKGKAAHVKHIEDSIWCFDSAISDEYPMEWFVDQVGVAGFANTVIPKIGDRIAMLGS